MLCTADIVSESCSQADVRAPSPRTCIYLIVPQLRQLFTLLRPLVPPDELLISLRKHAYHADPLYKHVGIVGGVVVMGDGAPKRRELLKLLISGCASSPRALAFLYSEIGLQAATRGRSALEAAAGASADEGARSNSSSSSSSASAAAAPPTAAAAPGSSHEWLIDELSATLEVS